MQMKGQSKLSKWFRSVILFPFSIMMGDMTAEIGEIPPETPETPPAQETQLSPEDAAIARGDVIVQPSVEALDADLLAEIATGEQPITTEVPEEKREDGQHIPRARFNEVNEENKTLKARLAELETGKETPAPAKVPAPEDPKATLRELRHQYRTALVEGDDTVLDVLEEKIDAKLVEIARNEASAALEQKTTHQTIKESLDKVATAAYEQYPFLDIKSPDADIDAVNAVRFHRDQLMADGVPAAEALQQAINEKGPKFAVILGKPLVNMANAERIKTEREKAAQTKAAATSVAQPAALPSKGSMETLKVDVNTLSPAQMKALPEEEKARLRGDTL